ncbi:GNAT family N-acetyltransferase [Paenisporosarcina sp. TG20]|uniref:GNAT family N-acetyltransferase n=1 Tax=Paenisporosarcina sp. TG20 TaxID=1211706 RepID=UPI0002FB0E7F|nr:GNAT family N-acetyltransferase [Paenisporosarcina sp. TG20]
MDVKLEKAIESDAITIFDLQVSEFVPLLNKYKDYNTNPANETIDKIVNRINNPSGGFYKIIADNILVGAICIYWQEESRFWISPMFILHNYQGQGIAQKAINLIENMFSNAKSWELATILEEERTCYLYEKMGFTKTGVEKTLNDSTTLVYYKKIS